MFHQGFLWKESDKITCNSNLFNKRQDVSVAPKYVIAIAQCFALFCEHLSVLHNLKWDALSR